MALRPNRKAQFLEQHLLCCFCGGGTVSQEIDHLPSRACFDNKHFPDSFEFPACRPCNASTKDDEQVVALLSRADTNPEAAAIPDEIGRYMEGVANNNPEVFAAMAREHGRLNENHGVFGLGDATDQALIRVLTRWAKAFHYRETGVIVPANCRIHINYFTNANVMHIPPVVMEGRVHELKRNGKNIGDQFAYITRNDPNRPDLGSYTAAFRRSFLGLMQVDFHGEVIGEDQAI